MRFMFLVLGVILMTVTAARGADWKLVWSDDFNYEGLPDKTKWDYEEGFVRNHEKQYYTRERLENARVEKGMLVLECRKEHFTPEKHAAVEYTSASLITLGKASWQYGRIEVRAKLPEGKGVWPAIWTLGVDRGKLGWPACGEIDIMEFVGKEPNDIFGTLHFRASGKHASDQGKMATTKPYEDFHVYATEWTPERIDFYFDATKYHSVPLDKAGKGQENPFRKPQYLLINFALGGGWGGAIDDAILPQKFLIKYVHVYSKDEATQTAPSPNKTQP